MPATLKKSVRCFDCKQAIAPSTNGCGTGYAVFRDNSTDRRICYACCANRDRADMIATGKASLYLTESAGVATVSNWPGTLAFVARIVRRSPKQVRERSPQNANVVAEFVGPDGKRWSAVSRGDMDLCRCRRIS